MGRGEKAREETRDSEFTWEQVQTHNKSNDRWIVIEDEVYDISQWSKKHPGGQAIISHYAGQDASNAFQAFHADVDRVKKYLTTMHVGHVTDTKKREINEDFLKLKERATKMGLFKPNVLFFILNVSHVVLLEAMAYFVLKWFGTGWIPWTLSVLFYATTQSQVGWVQHDFGHLSVFHNTTMDHLLHYLTVGFIKGASPHWWNHMHNQHHAKPNVIDKDPDVRVDKLFVVGKTMPVEVAKRRKKSMPFNWQHRYFFILGPPLLFPVYFQFMLFRHIFTRKKWIDLAVVMAFFAKVIYLYVPILGVWGTIVHYFCIRCLESHWFTWVSQSNHIPMTIDKDIAEEWIPMQIHATCDIEKSFFNDWFTGHLNHQIEHHLFPQMPRHNLYKIAPYVREICEKHNIPYVVKPLLQSFKDIVQSLKHSGELWYSTYNACHS
ncbi:hypothetical protein ScPMuIL_016875 [Solemya velum]